jgi:hypothetical protein
MEIYILPQDIRHREHVHCEEGIKKFCQRTGLSFESLMRGEVTADALRGLDTALGNEAARNAEERVQLECAAMPEAEASAMPQKTSEVSA